MTSITKAGVGYAPLSWALPANEKQAEADKPVVTGSTTSSASKSIHVDLSPLARSLSGKGGIAGTGGNDDIDKADLPQQIKDALKRIRQLKQELREAEEKLAKVQANNQLSEDEKKVQTEQLQAQIKSLHGALASANDALAKAVKQQKLSAEQTTSVATLMVRG
ncbi:hypothetical protein [Chitinimonas sp.]|uniref:hypothetical protein n=1 Tax=Chitinimonas sp. TaxID=1934313 RepID=UPI002F930F13